MKDGGATFSSDKTRRTFLWRSWEVGPRVMFICLNPSTADGKKDDQSTRKMRGFAERIGCGSFMLYNIFDFKATNPRMLYKMTLEQLCSPNNFAMIRAAARDVRYVICAWGTHGKLHGQGEAMLEFLRTRDVKNLYALKMNADGTPAHVLMLPYTSRLIKL